MNQKSDTVARLVVALGEAFRQKVSETTVNAYRIGLSGLTESQLQEAGGEALRRCKFMPSPAELREFASGGSDADQAITAWGDVQKAMPLGSYKHVNFQDRIINATIRNLGGWPMLFERCCNAEGEKWYRLEFVKTYQAFAASGVDGSACAALPGLASMEADGGVVRDAVPRQIGCSQRRPAMTSREQPVRLTLQSP